MIQIAQTISGFACLMLAGQFSRPSIPEQIRIFYVILGLTGFVLSLYLSWKARRNA